MLSHIEKIKYEGKNSTNQFAFKFYNPEEIICGKSMKEYLKFSLSYWHTLCGDSSDPFGAGTIDRNYSGETEMDKAKTKADFAFEIMQKLGIEYFCFHDVDIAPV